MTTRAYRIALGAALTVCAGLAIAVGYLLLQRNQGTKHTQNEDMDPVIASAPAPAGDTLPAAPAAASDPPLAPLQLSPQRMQEIGVKTAIAEVKAISNHLEAPGNVEIDEQNLSYVQTRFPGWIQSVFANATYQYVRKGQPLFTVYSPDLVSSEQEYLLARKNQAAFAQKMEGHEMAGQESDWLTQAAEQRLERFGVAPEEIAKLEFLRSALVSC